MMNEACNHCKMYYLFIRKAPLIMNLITETTMTVEKSAFMEALRAHGYLIIA